MRNLSCPEEAVHELIGTVRRRQGWEAEERALKSMTMRQPLKITHGKMLIFSLVFWGVAKRLFFCGRISAFSTENDTFGTFSHNIFFPLVIFYLGWKLLFATESEGFCLKFPMGKETGNYLNNSFYIEIPNSQHCPHTAPSSHLQDSPLFKHLLKQSCFKGNPMLLSPIFLLLLGNLLSRCRAKTIACGLCCKWGPCTL